MAYGFSFVPGLDGAKVVVRARGELEVELESEQTIDILHEVEQVRNLLFDLHTQHPKTTPQGNSQQTQATQPEQPALT